MKSVSIIAGGYLGQRLADALNCSKYEVKLSFRLNRPKFNVNWQSWYQCELAEGRLSYDEGLFDSDCVVICLPPGFKLGVGKYYPAHVSSLVEQAVLHGVNQVIFTSSVGVYAEKGVFDENSPIPAASVKQQALYDAEQAVLNSRLKYKQVVRLAGLMGPARHPGNFNVQLHSAQMDRPVNMVMIDDVVAAITTLILEPQTESQLYNLVAPHHPTKHCFYRFAQQTLDKNNLFFETETEHTDWAEPHADEKRVVGSRIEQETAFTYRHRDLFQALRSLPHPD